MEQCVGDTMPVGRYPGGASPYGALDMSGNVWEWTSSLLWDYPYKAGDGREDALAEGERVYRGGAWSFSTALVRAARRDGQEPSFADEHGGFRCVHTGSEP
jgi:formylglycine-generating enzyme required for sulfatase activity